MAIRSTIKLHLISKAMNISYLKKRLASNDSNMTQLNMKHKIKSLSINMMMVVWSVSNVSGVVTSAAIHLCIVRTLLPYCSNIVITLMTLLLH